MKRIEFKTESNISLFEKNHVSLNEDELREFTDLLHKVKLTLADHLFFVEYDEIAVESIQEFIIVSKGCLTFDELNGILFAFGIFINKVIIKKYGGKLVKNNVTGSVDVFTANTIFSAHEAILDLWHSKEYNEFFFLEFFDNVQSIIRMRKRLFKRYCTSTSIALN